MEVSAWLSTGATTTAAEEASVAAVEVSLESGVTSSTGGLVVRVRPKGGRLPPRNWGRPRLAKDRRVVETTLEDSVAAGAGVVLLGCAWVTEVCCWCWRLLANRLRPPNRPRGDCELVSVRDTGAAVVVVLIVAEVALPSALLASVVSLLPNPGLLRNLFGLLRLI